MRNIVSTTSALARRAGVLAMGAVAALGTMSSPAAADDAPATSTPVLRYTADGGERVEGVLEANKPVIIDYDLDRLRRCRSQYAGGDAWSIGVHYRIDGGPVQNRQVTQLDEDRHNVKVPVRVDLPLGARNLELWFHAGDRTGCSEYDSRFGANYHYTIEQPAIATFRADWSETVTGQIRAGRGLVVRYDIDRLPQCRETYNGSPAWYIDVVYRLDGGAAQSRTLTGPSGTAVPTTIDLASDTRRVELWFQVRGQRSGCVAYDSDFGSNYAFAAA
jgi:hypothetical protein